MAQSDRKRRRIWLRVLLAASLALNLFMIGGVAGLVLSAGGGPREGPPVADLELFRLVAILPPEDRAALRDTLRTDSDRGDWRAERRQFRDELIAAVMADPADAETLETLLAERRERRAADAERIEHAFARAVSSLPLDVREAYAERLRTMRDRHAPPPHGGKPHHDGPPGHDGGR